MPLTRLHASFSYQPLTRVFAGSVGGMTSAAAGDRRPTLDPSALSTVLPGTLTLLALLAQKYKY
jgi:hypothetical protein